MFKWDDSEDISCITPKDLRNPIYGFFYDPKVGGRTLSVADSEGFSQFQDSLVEHKNETENVEYNPLDVFLKAKRISTKQATANPHKKQISRSGYQLYAREMRPIVQRRNPDIPFGTITKMVAKMWNELLPAEQEQYCQRAKALPDGNDDGADQIGPGGDLYFGLPQAHQQQDDGTGTLYNLGLAGQFQN